MKNIFIAVFMAIGVAVTAQETKHDLADFEKIFVYDGLPVKLVRADENKAVVTGESREEVYFEIDKNTLKVKLGIDNIFDDDDDTQVLVYYKSIDEIRAKQNASILIGDKINAEFFTLEAQEGSDITGDFEVDNLIVLIRSGGEITPSGKTKHQEVNINTGGKYYAKNLQSEYLNIDIKAGGVADVTVSGKVTAKVKAGGTVNVYGDPEEIDKSTLFGGKVVRKN
ncbi:head GIN domain-containing protein [Zunongwangia endophytica]|uniref:Head GIN domain-containing protein n=1 Tax=Zunongwangia endophytica TaxID=1808945 RepID=A0ABV8H6F2_9FLAO|nr:head GIN domain-containing protein [Zunongwangia endophytica]MDN3595923.1 head GIN domain-containing protein [Zunongwangia endophytica]